MDKKKVILLVAALLIAGITAFMARSMFTGSAAPKASAAIAPIPTGPKIMVANKALPIGTIITADALSYKPWPKELVDEAYLIEGKSELTADKLVGYVVRNPITAGQPIASSALVSPDDRGFLAAVLGPGMRAVTVPVSKLTGVAGFVFPGDRVDLFLTQSLDPVDEKDRGGPIKVSETIVRNLRVLATDQMSSPAKDEKGQTIVSNYGLVTLEATPRLAEQITVAQALGTISLSLRPLADSASELEHALASGAVSIPKGATPEEEQSILNSVTKMPKAGRGSFATGGDISSFSRRGTPASMVNRSEIQRAVAEAKTMRVVETIKVDNQRLLEKVRKGPVVRVSSAGQVTEVELNRR